MFLANSLKEKLKRDYIEGESESDGPLFRYEPPPKNPKVLLSFKEMTKSNQEIESPLLWNIPSHQLHAFDKKEWEKTFTLSRLHDRWKEKGVIDFDYKYKKFPDNSLFQGVREKKDFIKNFRDPDILSLKPRRWNISTNVSEKYTPELKKVLFQEKHGLGEFMITPLKIPHPPEGVDSRDKIEIDGGVWDVSNYVDKREIEEKDNHELISAKENTIKYWRQNEEDRYYQRALPISNERKRIEVIRYYKRYRTPIQKSVDFLNTMDKVKEATIFEKENVIKKVKKNNPGMENYPEKIDALVFREMYHTYKDKYNELIGNLPKEELKRRQMEKNKFRWTDKDLVNKITAINKFTNTGFFDNEANNLTFEKSTQENKVNNTDISNTQIPKDQSTKNTMKRSQSLNYSSNSLILPLVIRGNEINREEEKIEEKLEEEFKKEQKRQLLLESKSFRKVKHENKFESRYPLSKEKYLNSKNKKEIQNMSGNMNRNKSYITTSNLNPEIINSMNEISKSSNCNPHFLEAFNRIAEKEFEKINKNKEKEKENDIKNQYTHPGIYRTFDYVEKFTKIKRDITGEETMEVVPKKITETFWSCCMNSDKNSKGCQKIASKKFKWNYD